MTLRMLHTTAVFATLLGLAATAAAQDARPVAFTNARLYTLEGEPIEHGTLLVRDGKIAELGADVAVPAGARIVDCKGDSIMPGLVSAYSHVGLINDQAQRPQPMQQGRRGRRGGPPMETGGGRGGAVNAAATKVTDKLYAQQPAFGELLRAGVTTLALTPIGNGLPGLGARLSPDGGNLQDLVADDAAFVYVGMAMDSAVKKLLKEQFEKAAQLVEQRKKPPEPAKPETAPAPKPPEPAKPEAGKEGSEPPKPEPPKPDAAKEAARPAPPPKPKDQNLEVLADLLEGKRRAMLEIGSAAELLHWFHAVGNDVKFPRCLLNTRYDSSQGTIDTVIDEVKKLSATAVLLPPTMSTLPRSRYLVHPAKTLHDAGIDIGFVIGANRDGVRTTMFQLLELVRYGLPADVALKGVTLVPAKMLGVDAEVGSLKVGKQANLLLFRGDVLDPTSELRSVWLRGVEVTEQAKAGGR